MKRRLGRGLDTLIGGADPAAPIQSADLGAQLPQIDVDTIDRNPFQPRQEFDEKTLGELVESIRQHGVLQPLIVRPQSDGYQLVAGERRLIAARKAGLTTVPCQVRDLEDQTVCEVAIEENLKRKDLNVLEKAQAFKDYLDRFGSTIEELASTLSMDRSTVSNLLRLLELPDPVKKALRTGKITNGHARALLSLEEPDQIALCERIQKESLSVRKTEKTVRALVNSDSTIPFPKKSQPDEKPTPSNHVLSLQNQLRDLLGVPVEIRLQSAESGRIILSFRSKDEFEQILRNLRRAA